MQKIAPSLWEATAIAPDGQRVGWRPVLTAEWWRFVPLGERT